MSHFINGWTNLFWCIFTSVWWCSESNILHHSDDTCQSFTKGFIWWIIMHHHQYKLNITASMLIARFYYQPLKKVIFSSPGICGNILNIFGMGLKPPKLLYKINWDTWKWIVLLEIELFGRLYIVLGIYDIGFTIDKARGMWRI